MFLSTLGLTKDTIITTALQKTSESQLTPSPDLQGYHVPPNKKAEEVLEHVKSHIMSYNPCISHYTGKHEPNRLYISPEFTLKVMYNAFCDSNQDLAISYSFYLSQIAAMNISFVKLGNEDCKICDIHDHHLQEVHSVHKNDISMREEGADNSEKGKKTFENCKECSDFTEHITLPKEGRKAYRSDKKEIAMLMKLFSQLTCKK